MPATRAIKLKLVVPRHQDNLDAARSLWITHAAVNEAVRYYENVLLEMRGAGYLNEDEQEVTAADVGNSLEQTIEAARVRSGNGSPLSSTELPECKRLLRQLYVAIIPSAIEKRGDAKNANGYLGPLTDPDSTGFTKVFEKITNPPPWIEQVRNGEVEGFAAAQKWLASDDGHARMSATGRPPRWINKARRREADWPVDFVTDFDKKCDEAQGVPSAVMRLKSLGALPLFPAYLTPNITGARGQLNPWDRLAFRLAAGHMMSWESWCIRSAKEHHSRQERVNAFRQRHLSDSVISLVDRLRVYESERHEELCRVAFAPERPFRITPRMVRSWSMIKERWQRSKDKTEEALTQILKDQQTKLRGRFGDAHLFKWLALAVNHDIWDRVDDVVDLVAKLNAMQALVERSRETARMTLPDPRYHPRSAQWEAEGGSNLRSYTLQCEDDGALVVALPLLCAVNSGQYEERTHRFKIAKSGQFTAPQIDRVGKVTNVEYLASNGDTVTGKLGSGDLLMNWSHLQNRPIDRVMDGDIGPAFLKIAINMDEQLPDGWDGKRPAAVNHFLSAQGGTKYLAAVKPGLRVLSVDLGVRTFASCSVFELVQRQPERGLNFPIHGSGLWAKHERSFLLKLPDEEVGVVGKRWREAAASELRDLRRALYFNRRLYRLVGLPDHERVEQLDLFEEDCTDGLAATHALPIVQALKTRAGFPSALWDDQVKAAVRSYRIAIGRAVSDWRKRTRPRTSSKKMGKSMWAIDYLTNVRRFLQSWTLAGSESGQINRLDRDRWGVFASGLLEHINGIKGDRLKTGSDLVVQAARGFLRDDDGRWEERYAPCQVVLFEDLSRYRMKTDRPRRENSQLMKWAHRSVPKEVEMQGALYGIFVIDTAAAFSSRYHAASLTPGIRCHAIRATDIDDEFFMELVARENPGLDTTALKHGDLVALGGGEIFASLNAKGVARTHADINAAQNLQRRFWTQHGDAFRLSCILTRIDGVEVWVPRSMGKKALGALGGYGYLTPTGHASGSARWTEIKKRLWSRLVGESSDEETEV